MWWNKNAAKYQTDTDWRDTLVINPDEVDWADKKNALLVICIVTLPVIALKDDTIRRRLERHHFFLRCE